MSVLIFLALNVALASCRITQSQQQGSQICYDGLSCFSNQPPFDNADGLLPQPPNHINTTFRLFTRTCSTPRVLHHGDAEPMCGFDISRPTKVIIHGFLQHGQVPWVVSLAREFLRKEPMNVIAVDWGSGSGFPYSQAVANTRVVGAEVSRFLRYLRDTNNLSHDDVHIIGHSLGAHVSGYAGNGSVGRITGLDPAEPDFKDTDPAVHLERSDAHFVDVIHTDGSEFNYDSGFGWIQELGHIDFYPNGGVNQPGCAHRVITGVLTAAYRQGLRSAEEELSCSHSRSIHLFNESINSPCPFYGHPCQSLADLDSNHGNCLRCERGRCPEMGMNADQTQARGKFYLRTRSSGPFCGYPQHVEVEFGGFMTPVAGHVTIELHGDDQTSETIVLTSGDAAFQSGEMRDTFFIDRERIDHVTQVRVSFTSAGSGSWWWYENDQSSIVVYKITVTSAESGRRIHFCGDHNTVRNGNSITLTRSSTDPNVCRMPPLVLQQGQQPHGQQPHGHPQMQPPRRGPI